MQTMKRDPNAGQSGRRGGSGRRAGEPFPARRGPSRSRRTQGWGVPQSRSLHPAQPGSSLRLRGVQVMTPQCRGPKGAP